MAGHEYTAKDKKVQKMTREGLTEVNLHEQTAKNISQNQRKKHTGPPERAAPLAEEKSTEVVEEKLSRSKSVRKHFIENEKRMGKSLRNENYVEQESKTAQKENEPVTGKKEFSYGKKLHQTEKITEKSTIADKKEEIHKKAKQKRLFEEQKKASRLSFDDEAGEMIKGAGTGFGRKAVDGAAVVAVHTVHDKISEAQDDNSAVEGAHKSELLAEESIRISKKVQEKRRMSSGSALKHSNSEHTRGERLNFGTPEYAKTATQETVNRETGKTSSVSKFWQKKRYKDAYKKARTGTAAVSGSAVKETVTEKIKRKVKQTFIVRKNPMIYFLIMVLLLVVIICSFQSCAITALGPLTTITTTTWPADDEDITKAETYYTKLEAELQKKINNMQNSQRNYDEYNFSIDEIGHDPVVLISYLSAKYGSFKFREVKSEMDRLFAMQYDLDVKTTDEIRTVTKKVKAGDSLGTVVTSAYCSCSICCGQWAGGPTASGVYPRADHTIAVDANNPTVPMGTEIIMNGKLYKVEDTGNFDRYGVDFDIYFDDHATATAWGHRSFEAFYAGGDGQEIEVTTTERVKACYVSLDTRNLEDVVKAQMSEEEKSLYEIYIQSKGNRVFFGTPFEYDWHQNIVGNYGYRTSGTSIHDYEYTEVLMPQGTKVLSVMDGTVKDISDGSITLENEKGYKVKITNCSNIRVNEGAEVKEGDVIAKVNSQGSVRISFTYHRTSFNPYFYLDVGEGSVYGAGGNVSAKAGALITEAMKYRGVPYVWGGYSPSGFDCSGFVSYAINHCGAGWNIGRLTADGLRGICRTIPSSQAQAGDLIFFQGTYDTPGASHVGIYLGNGEMIHCGKPVQVTSINSSYWQQHFLSFGRLP